MKYINFITGGVLFALLLAGCSDEFEKEPIVLPVSGDEIEFGAAPGGFTDVNPESRTIYDVPAGSTFDNYTLLNIKWQYGKDTVRVYCPEAAEGFRTADYTVQEATDASSGTSTGYLVKNGETGVRWGDTGQPHNFYAFYSLGKIDEGLQNGTTVTATIPTGQEGGKLLTYNNDGNEDPNGTFKIITPDMSFCMMAGKGTWNPEDDNPEDDKNVALTFTPIVTVLDVLINGPEDVKSMNIVSVSVRSKSGKNIVGTFSYNLADNTYNFDATDNSQTAASIATVQTIIDNNPVSLKKNEQLNVKFFLLPRDISNGDLVVSVLTEGGVVYSKTISGSSTTSGGDGVLGAGLITRIKTPKLGGQQPNNWMSQIPDNVLFSQLSLPGSKHAFSYNTAESFDPNTGISHYYQALPPLEIRSGETGTFKTTQFDEGVRVFDVHLNLTSDSRYATPIVYAGGANLDPEYTLSEVLTALNEKIHPNSKPVTECAVVFLNFVNGKSVGGTDDVSTWLSAVMNALDRWNQSNSHILTTFDANTTMLDMRGQIAIIINLENSDNLPSGTAPVNYITGLSTSVQNTGLVSATYSSGAPVRIQNLQQCNNPNFESTEAGNFGYREEEGIGLVPYFITKANYDDPSVSCNLIETKKTLMKQINSLIASNAGNLYINDLSGFCVTANYLSTGYVTYRRNERGDWNVLWNYGDDINLYDYAKLPTDGDFYSSSAPSNPSGGDVWYQIPHVNYSDLGNGGNTCLFAQIFNAKAVDEYSSLVGSLRQPLGIILMNFAGVATVKEYAVQGIRLPGLIMMNNFMFPLKTGTTTTRSSSDTTYSKEGNVWD
ncbi:hypothetical protein H6A61_08080 [Bacteroides caecigallinarum]|uniref:hypothetical protein n=1 Tax=Bacteroides caecigallinarum TaxID=1411144 RepID=UPI00195652BD|nr:hypothetical protein [Bacteroides caecigallinarum]MBM6960803.1 hypothetical protein [Bacteroides caecigallinarum]